jgi:hypothetical protein
MPSCLTLNQPSREIPDKNRSVWVGATPEMIKDVHGDKPHPFAETGKFGDSELATVVVYDLQY